MTLSPLRAALLLGLGVALWCAPGAWMRATDAERTTADEPQYLMTARSLWFDRDLDVANQRASGDYRAFHEIGLPLQEEVQPDGSRVSPHDPLLPFLLALPAGLGGWLAAKLALAGLAGVLAGLTAWIAMVRFGVSTRVALLVVGAGSLAAPLAVYATQVYPELAAAACVAAAVAALSGDLRRRSARTVVLVSLVGLAWLSVKYAPVVVALGAVGLVRIGSVSRRAQAWFVAGAGLAVAVFAVAHLRWYGGLTPYAAGAHFAGGELTVAGRDPDVLGRSVRLAGLMVDRDFGLAVWQPLYLLAVPALVALVASRHRNRWLLAVPLAAGWGNATFVALTMHGWWFPGRQVVVVLPLMLLAVAWYVERRAALVRWVVAAGALGASLAAWLAVEVLLDDLRVVTTFADLRHPWWRTVRVLLPDGRRHGMVDAFLLAVWTAGMLAVAWRTWRSERVAGEGRGEPLGRAAWDGPAEPGVPVGPGGPGGPGGLGGLKEFDVDATVAPYGVREPTGGATPAPAMGGVTP